MIEKPRLLPNANRQFTLALFVTLASIFLIWYYPFRLGLDLSGGTALIYEVDIDQAIERGDLPNDVERSVLMAEMVSIINERVDPEGITEALVTQRGDQYIQVELPDMTDIEAEQVERRIETLGRLEMRIVADESYSSGGVKFNLQKERENLRAWLDKDGGANRRAISRDPVSGINPYNTLDARDGGILATGHLKWYPAKVRPSYRNSAEWDRPMSSYATYTVEKAYDQEEFSAGPEAFKAKVLERLLREERPTTNIDEFVYLVELVAINMHEEHFTGENLEAAGVRKTLDSETGLPAVSYVMREEHKGRYADFSDRYREKACAIILNNVVTSAPVFQSRIYGSGQIRGGFTDAEASDLVKVLKTGSLQVKPTRLSKTAIGATLGARSIQLGGISILVGGMLVMLFMLFYYRMAGLVAVVGLTLNVLLIIGIMQFIRATFTLPGLAGIVLTIGMAVDANILIYERIREEVNRGKALLQAVSAGFDRAMVTILDANITTFLVGMVLYNIGIGPIRGFAVTLMIGILTSVFTAFFISRLVFHYLLVSGKMKGFNALSWFQSFDFDFLKYGKRAVVLSVVVIGAGLVNTVFIVPPDRSLGLDFLGGANMRVVLREPMTADALRNRLADDPEFKKSFPNPLVNTAGQTVGGQASEFAIKMKLTETLREKIAADREAAANENRVYVPLYQELLHAALDDLLVETAYSDVALAPVPGRPSVLGASMQLHFQQEVVLQDLQSVLRTSLSPDTVVRAVGAGDVEPETAKDVIVEFDTDATSTADTLFGTIQLALKDFRGVGNSEVRLSNPIPESDEIGGRMVGELRNAAIGALIISWFLMIMYVRLRFHEYKYGIAAVAALIHDVLVALVAVVFFNHIGLVNAEIDLALIAALLTVVGYSVNDTIVIFDRIRENLSEQERLGDTHETFSQILNRSLNQTLPRTILTTGCTLFVVVAQFVINYGSGSSLEAFAFALFFGMVAGTYSTIFIASPIILWIRNREEQNPVKVTTSLAPAAAKT